MMMMMHIPFAVLSLHHHYNCYHHQAIIGATHFSPLSRIWNSSSSLFVIIIIIIIIIIISIVSMIVKYLLHFFISIK